MPDDGSRQWRKLSDAYGPGYDQHTPLVALSSRYRSIPSLADVTGEHPEQWYTYYPNNPGVSGPDRTIDYVFYSNQWQLQRGYVRYWDTLDASDHLPLVGEFTLPGASVLPGPGMSKSR